MPRTGLSSLRASPRLPKISQKLEKRKLEKNIARHSENAAREAVAQGERVWDPSLVRGLPEDERHHDENECLHKKNERVQRLLSSEVMIMAMVMMVMILPHSRRDTRGLSQYGYIAFFLFICQFIGSWP